MGYRILFFLFLISFASQASTMVECKGRDFTAYVDHLVKEVYDVRLVFKGGTTYRFQTNGVVRSDRGFVTRGVQGLVYSPGENGLEGWVALGDDAIYKDLSCKFLH